MSGKPGGYVWQAFFNRDGVGGYDPFVAGGCNGERRYLRRSIHPDFCATSGAKTQAIMCNVNV